MKKFTIFAGTALIAATGAALAQPATGPRVDRNTDVTRQQMIERADRRFARLDTDNDGRATAAEAREAGEQRRAQRAGRMFERLDLDQNGSITRAEFDQARSQRREQRAERGGHMRGMRAQRAERLFGEQGFVTRDRLRERAIARFERLDANRDGTLTAAERQQARQQRRQQRQERRGQTG